MHMWQVEQLISRYYTLLTQKKEYALHMQYFTTMYKETKDAKYVAAIKNLIESYKKNISK